MGLDRCFFGGVRGEGGKKWKLEVGGAMG